MERVRECFNQIYWSWKIILSMMFLLACLIIGFHNSERLKRTGLSNIPRQLYELSTDYGSKLYDYQARIRMPKVKMELLRVGSHNLESNSQEILSLTKQIDILKALLKDIKNKMDNYILNPNTEAFGKQDDSDITNEEMVILVNYVLKKLREDQVQMADYALKSAGASIVEAGTSESYKNDKAKLYWHGIGFLSYEMPPDVILQPDVHPGKCWAFPGSKGHTIIKLARKITPTAVTMEHISEKISPSGNTSSAPKDFSVYGLKEECKGEEIFLGQFMYNKKGTSVQTFHLQNEVSEYLLCVKLKILNNWGHPKYTCLYRFRVHGKPETDGLGAP
ncbi:SUN domain-containing protein 3 isoform X1 [Monodelphis domestica]|uniref:SUN domain-containing protein 3 n=2 Tax=Monodelphis domestica TaxID=13616 RepID=F7BKT5_MONDO|nr:SUN domain-containing protein 3 isoform X1 [Monodelphis domestica]XP_056660838.1 SUN domain-containing protein 3 isoform X1 [Monodelphis domestica]